MRDIISDHAFFEHCLKDEYNKGYADAKKALEQESYDDAISRTDMLDAIGHGTTYTSEDLQRIIKDLPSVTPKREQGEWIDCQDEGYVECYEEYETQEVVCDECGKKFTVTPYLGDWSYKTETIDGEMTDAEYDEMR